MEQSFFDKLLQKPESYRRNVAYGLTAVIGLFIFAGWFMVMSQSLRKASLTDAPTKNQAAEDLRKQLPSLKQQDTIKTRLTQQQEEAGQSGQMPPTPDDITEE